MQSPMAYTPFTEVCRCSPTTILFLSSSFTPNFSKSMSSVRGRLPIATSTTSASMLMSAPPLTGSAMSVTPSARTDAAFT
jgi:hypothetical protein